MAFSWYEPDLPGDYLKGGKQKAAAMYEAEIRDRAALLQRLGYSKEEAKLRLRGNVRWDFELEGTPAHLARVGSIVDKVYAARGAGTGGPPSL